MNKGGEECSCIAHQPYFSLASYHFFLFWNSEVVLQSTFLADSFLPFLLFSPGSP